jgi:hypothetical protein
MQGIYACIEDIEYRMRKSRGFETEQDLMEYQGILYYWFMQDFGYPATFVYEKANELNKKLVKNGNYCLKEFYYRHLEQNLKTCKLNYRQLISPKITKSRYLNH